MNKERILRLAELIEAAPHRRRFDTTASARKPTGFNMAEWHCGTCACIGGWAESVFKSQAAESSLDLDFSVATDLFYPRDEEFRRSVTPSQAARVLHNLAETGRVDWAIGAQP